MSRVPKLLISKDRWVFGSSQGIALAPKEKHYLVRVLRLHQGAPITVFDGEGKACIGSLQMPKEGTAHICLEVNKKGSFSKREATHVPKPDEEAGLPQGEIILLQGLLKHNKFDWVIEKATELGVHRIIPVQCSRSISSADGERWKERLSRWHRIAQSAAQQCQRNDVPLVEPVLSFAEAVIQNNLGTKILFWEGEKTYSLLEPIQRRIESVQNRGSQKSQNGLPDRNAQPISVFIGPEGGFEENEVSTAREQGFSLCTLGPTILRAETAAVSAVAIVRFLLHHQSHFHSKT